MKGKERREEKGKSAAQYGNALAKERREEKGKSAAQYGNVLAKMAGQNPSGPPMVSSVCSTGVLLTATIDLRPTTIRSEVGPLCCVCIVSHTVLCVCILCVCVLCACAWRGATGRGFRPAEFDGGGQRKQRGANSDIDKRKRSERRVDERRRRAEERKRDRPIGVKLDGGGQLERRLECRLVPARECPSSHARRC